MRKLLIFLGIALLLSGCGWLNPNIMLKTGKDYQYTKFSDSVNKKEYRLSSNDILEFSLYSNEGFKLVDLTSLNSANMGYRFENSIQYLIESDGFCKLPILGRMKLNGMTIKEVELQLEEKYSAYYIKPFVIVKVLNKRVIVFPGSAGDAKVIPLVNNNTTLIEAIALAGGIADDGKARQIKLIRDVGGSPEVYLIDLSKIEGIKLAGMVLQSNDIIYIEPRRKVSSKIVQELAPIVSILTSIFIIITYSRAISR
ncbi:MAG TPA: polysaccharide biosynthesis/export family protein [Bacteroidia bacterium]|jgi:polysaccharide export outer membrane protein